MANDPQNMSGTQASAEDHDPQGVEILMSEPSRLMRLIILAVFALIVAAVAWSFIGKADVIVKASGMLNPEGDVRRVYIPVNGQLVDNYMVEGSPVTKGDVLARINSPDAVQIATKSAGARMALEIAEQNAAVFEEKKKVMEFKAEMIRQQVDDAESQHQQRLQEGMAKLMEKHQVKLEKLQTQLDQARRAMDIAREDWQRHERLRKTPGEGGVSAQKVKEKQNEYLSKRTDYQLKQSELGEFEVTLNKEKLEVQKTLQTGAGSVLEFKTRLGEHLVQIEQQELESASALAKAKYSVQTAERITFDDIDEDSFLLVRAPVSGVISGLVATQAGEQLEAKKPIASIAPADAPMIMDLEIPEQNRAFIHEGMPLKIKLNAFPYQRYGSVEGTLKYVAPTASRSSRDEKQIVFKAKAALSRDRIEVNKVAYPFRYGMLGVAEITVRKRRLIDMALDPFRKLAG
jgi:HlyD family secretion protein